MILSVRGASDVIKSVTSPSCGVYLKG